VLFASKLPPIHRDPFDRILVAQALTERMTLLTNYQSIVRYDVDVVFW
jgi:PIN domain nuclease of toxin-antitoxin system